MALTLRQAQAANTLLEWLLDPTAPPLNADVIDAAAQLAEGAYIRLQTGISGPELERRAQVCHR